MVNKGNEFLNGKDSEKVRELQSQWMGLGKAEILLESRYDGKKIRD